MCVFNAVRCFRLELINSIKNPQKRLELLAKCSTFLSKEKKNAINYNKPF